MIRETINVMTIIDDSDNISFLDTTVSDGVARIVLWCRDGLFRLIPRPVIINLSDAHRTTHDFFIRWEQGVDLDPKIAKILLGE